MHKIKVNPMATEDLIEIKNYITKELKNPTAAVNVISKIIEKYEDLKEFPLMGADLSSKINVRTDFRYVVSGNYLVFYRADLIRIQLSHNIHVLIKHRGSQLLSI